MGGESQRPKSPSGAAWHLWTSLNVPCLLRTIALVTVVRERLKYISSNEKVAEQKLREAHES